MLTPSVSVNGNAGNDASCNVPGVHPDLLKCMETEKIITAATAEKGWNLRPACVTGGYMQRITNALK